MYAKGYVAATDGNVSVRLRNGNVLTTRTGVNKGLVKAADIVEINPEGIPLTRAVHPSTEIGMHLFIYGKRPDIGAVVHAHPPFATGFATAREALDGCVFPEVIVGMGGIPLAPYATPSTAEVAASIAPYVGETEVILLANHGVVTYGRDVMTAYFLLEKVEQTACSGSREARRDQHEELRQGFLRQVPRENSRSGPGNDGSGNTGVH
jgi:L-fuculose-phosphate aldolase